MYRIRPQEMQDMCKMIPCSSAFMVTLWYTRQPSAPGHCLYPEFLPRVDVTDVSHLEKLRKTEDFVPKWLDAPWFNMKFSGWMWNDIFWRHRLDGISLKLSFEHKHVYIEKSVLDLELSTWMDKYPTILILVQVKGVLAESFITSGHQPRTSTLIHLGAAKRPAGAKAIGFIESAGQWTHMEMENVPLNKNSCGANL